MLVGVLWITRCYVALGAELSGELEEELLAMLGPMLIMPLSSAVTFLAGELLSGPTESFGRPLLVSIVGSQAAFLAGTLSYGGIAFAVGKVLGERAHLSIPAWAGYLVMMIPYALGGLGAAWGYLWLRGPVIAPAPRPAPTT